MEYWGNLATILKKHDQINGQKSGHVSDNMQMRKELK